MSFTYPPELIDKYIQPIETNGVKMWDGLLQELDKDRLTELQKLHADLTMKEWFSGWVRSIVGDKHLKQPEKPFSGLDVLRKKPLGVMVLSTLKRN